MKDEINEAKLGALSLVAHALLADFSARAPEMCAAVKSQINAQLSEFENSQDPSSQAFRAITLLQSEIDGLFNAGDLIARRFKRAPDR